VRVQSVRILRSAEKEYFRLPSQVRHRVRSALEVLASPGSDRLDLVPVQGRPGAWRIRVGSHRVVFELVDGVAWVTQIDHRSRVYDR
jgi:mRNA-degrading endonuclease RelE of RelBE toxin-antitoxin system